MNKYLILFILSILMLQAQAQNTWQRTFINESKEPINDLIIAIPLDADAAIPFGQYVATDGENSVPVEISTNLAGAQSLIFPVAILKPGESRTFTFCKGMATQYPKRTYAELVHKTGGRFEGHTYKGGYSWVKTNYLRKPDNFRDHAYYIKYEGPGWESDKVGFRFYLDQRNAIDVFGKKVSEIVLPFVGVDGYDSYHQMADWGMDNMKVGESLGIGSIAVWNGQKAIRVEETDSVVCSIPMDGKIRSQVLTRYYGWNANGTRCNLTSLISIDAGSRASHMELHIDGTIDNLATGIIKADNTEFLTGRKGEWTYIATFGRQSLNNDMMGLALFFRTAQLKEIACDALNHVVVLKPTDGNVDYYFMPTWELDKEPIKTRDDFIKCIDEVLTRLTATVTELKYK